MSDWGLRLLLNRIDSHDLIAIKISVDVGYILIEYNSKLVN